METELTEEKQQQIQLIVENNYGPKALSWEEAENLQGIYGKNILDFQRPTPWWKLLLIAVIHPFNGILLLLAIISAATGDFATMGIMLSMILLSFGVRFIQELKSNIAAQSLRKMVTNKTKVIRLYRVPDDRDPLFEDIDKLDKPFEQDISIEDVVPGDIVTLSAGDMIPADMELFESKDLFISQSLLTGEAIPVEKYVLEPGAEKKQNKLERIDMCLMGTSVVSGIGKGVIIDIGPKTVFGELAKQLAKNRASTAFSKNLRKVSFAFIGIMIVMLPAVFLINGLIAKGWLEAFLFAVAVAVGLTPEMLPMIVNANLARGAVSMSKKKSIVKNLDSIINLGGITVLCTDKTGTLTQDKVALIQYLDMTGKPTPSVLQYAYLNSHFQTGLKNLLDVAVIEYYEKQNPSSNIQTEYTKIDEIPFDFMRKRMSVILHQNETQAHYLITKGALEETLKICSHIQIGADEIVELTSEDAEKAKVICEGMNQDGLRVVGVAMKKLESYDNKRFGVKDEEGLTFLGFIAFLDPPKESTAPAIEQLIQRGITIKVLTGDAAVICKKVCNQVNLPVNGIITGSELQAIESEEEFDAICEKTTIFAKLSPMDKAKVVKTLKKKHVVGFLGDGINDAAALKEADVGISVDTAADVAKESADIILLEKSLLVLVKGVIVGRTTYGNTIKYIKMAISSNFGNVFSVLVASAWLPYLPMLPTQILLQNLLYDFSQLAIPWDRMDEEFLMVPTKWTVDTIIKFMIFIGPWSSIFDMTTFSLMWFYYDCKTPDQQALTQSAWFVEGLLTQTLVVHMIRTPKIPLFQSRATWPVILGTAIVCGIGVAIPFTPIAPYIGMVPVPGLFFPYLIGVIIGYCTLVNIAKPIYIRIFKSWI